VLPPICIEDAGSLFLLLVQESSKSLETVSTATIRNMKVIATDIFIL
jgi:hypothetical protein